MSEKTRLCPFSFAPFAGTTIWYKPYKLKDMDYKLEYMERLFAKIGKKKTESYVISRIWHLLDDDRVKFVVQQYIKEHKTSMRLRTCTYLNSISSLKSTSLFIKTMWRLIKSAMRKF